MSNLFFKITFTTLIFIVSINCFSQVNNIEVKLYDITDSLDMEYEQNAAIVKIGNKYRHALPFLGSFDAGNLTDLEDTLYLNHFDYKFDTLPMKYYDFTFVDKTVLLKVYAKPSYNYHYSKDVAVSYSEVTQNDSVTLKAFSPNNISNAEVILTLNNGEKHIFKKGKGNMYFATLFYDDLENGWFQINTKNGNERFSFDKEKWYQTYYLTSLASQKPLKREERLIHSYFEHVKKSEEEYKRLERKTRQEKDSLLSVIRKLQGKDPAPVLELEPIEEDFFVFISQNASPKERFSSFFNHLQGYLIFENRRNGIAQYAKYAGNITLELTVFKDGNVSIKPLHQMKNSDKIYSMLLKYIKKEEWTPATRNGRVCNQTIVLSLNLVGNKQAIKAQRQTEKFEPTEDMVKIEPLKNKKIVLEVGQKIYYQADVHGSVGSWVNAISKNEEVIENIDSHFAYHRVQIEGETGGDRATKTYIFEAKKKGKATLRITHTFRGETRGERTIKIIVK